MKRLLLALALFGALPLSSNCSFALAQPASGVAAEVNGDKIPASDLSRMVDSFKAGNPALSANTPEAQKALADIKTQVLEDLITTRLLAQEAKRQKIAAQPKAIDEALGKLRKANFKDEAEFQSWLKTEGKSVPDIRRSIADELAIRELSTNLTRDIVVSDSEIGDYYRAHLDRFQIPEAVKAHHILLAINPNASPADKQVVMNRALSLMKQLKAGANFEALAKANSDDPGSKDQGGNLGAFPRGEMIESFEKAAFGAKAGEVVGPVTTEFGVHILRVDEKLPARTLTLPEVQNDPQIGPAIKNGLLKQKVEKRLAEQITKLRASANIKKNA